MKIIKEWEAEDIDLSDKLNATLFSALLLNYLQMGDKKALTENSTSPEKSTLHFKGCVASFLNIIDKEGYILVPKEPVPSAFYKEDKV